MTKPDASRNLVGNFNCNPSAWAAHFDATRNVTSLSCRSTNSNSECCFDFICRNVWAQASRWVKIGREWEDIFWLPLPGCHSLTLHALFCRWWYWKTKGLPHFQLKSWASCFNAETNTEFTYVLLNLFLSFACPAARYRAKEARRRTRMATTGRRVRRLSGSTWFAQILPQTGGDEFSECTWPIPGARTQSGPLTKGTKSFASMVHGWIFGCLRASKKSL